MGLPLQRVVVISKNFTPTPPPPSRQCCICNPYILLSVTTAVACPCFSRLLLARSATKVFSELTLTVLQRNNVQDLVSNTRPLLREVLEVKYGIS
jgi:hypothetical protein